MYKQLYFVCPTDHLETVINNHFPQKNYYLTSLGSSFHFNCGFVEEINSLMETKEITEINFVLSDNNKLILDALKSQDFKNVRGLKRFYDVIIEKEKRTTAVWQTSDIQISIISYYLDLKKSELQSQLSNRFSDRIKISTKIYFRRKNVFNEIYPDIFSLNPFHLN